MKIQVSNQVCLKGMDSNLLDEKVYSIDELSMLVLSPAKKLGLL